MTFALFNPGPCLQAKGGQAVHAEFMIYIIYFIGGVWLAQQASCATLSSLLKCFTMRFASTLVILPGLVVQQSGRYMTNTSFPLQTSWIVALLYVPNMQLLCKCTCSFCAWPYTFQGLSCSPLLALLSGALLLSCLQCRSSLASFRLFCPPG